MKRIFSIIALIVLFLSASVQFVEAFGGPITSPFSKERLHPVYGYIRRHDGADIGIGSNTKVPAAFDGEVIVADWWDGYGNYLRIRRPDGYIHCYAHLNEINVSIGEKVKAGQIVALSGNTGVGTGPHLHFEMRKPDGTPIEPVPYMLAAGWDLTYSGLEGNETGEGGILDKFKKWVDFRMDMDWTTYIKPSVILKNTGDKVFSLLKSYFGTLQNALLDTLIALILLDFLWYLGRIVVLAEDFNPAVFFPKIMRYGFFMTLFKGWDWLINNLAIPTMEALSNGFGQEKYTVAKMLEFDQLYNALSRIIGSCMHLTWSFIDNLHGKGLHLITYVVLNALIFIILILSVLLCLYLLLQMAKFYLVCVFGVLGIPLAFIPYLKYNSSAPIGSIFSAMFHLIVLAVLYGMMINHINSMPAIADQSLAQLMVFTAMFGFLVYFVMVDSEKYAKYFENLAFNMAGQ